LALAKSAVPPISGIATFRQAQGRSICV
jgi:hypothetical protein